MKPIELLSTSHSLLSDRVRLAIMATLAATTEPLDFNRLLEDLSLTKGNLSSHTQKLEEAGLIVVKKEFVGKKPRTTYACTDAGRKEVETYLKGIEALLKQTVKGL